MTTLREAAEMALDALDSINAPLNIKEIKQINKASNALRSALEQPDHTEQPLEMGAPVAWIFTWYEIANDRYVRRIIDCEERPNIPGYDLIPLYTAPPKRKWQGLTDEEIEDEWERITGHSIFGGDKAEGRAMYLAPDEVTEFTRAIEAKLKEKNT